MEANDAKRSLSLQYNQLPFPLFNELHFFQQQTWTACVFLREPKEMVSTTALNLFPLLCDFSRLVCSVVVTDASHLQF